jgi:hypothetical protein
MVKVFLGYDPREAIGFHVCVESILKHASRPIEIIPIRGEQRDGTNAFTYARFLVPYLCEYKGGAVFLDGSDMLVREDIVPLADYACDTSKAVHVVQHHYRTKHPRKYIGTPMEADNRDYPCKNWSSVMVFNCGHVKHRALHPDSVKGMTGSQLHQFKWLRQDEIGELPARWNVLIGEEGEQKDCAIAHFTLGIPAFPEYASCRYANEWSGIEGSIGFAP